MKVYVETNPETIYSGRVKDEVKTAEVRMWFETDEEIEVLSLADYAKQVRKEVIQELKNKILYCSERIMDGTHYYNGKELDEFLDQIQGE